MRVAENRLWIVVVFLFVAGLLVSTSSAGLVSRWQFEGNANDSAGGNHGTVYGGAQYVAGAPGFGQGLSFDGVNDYVGGSASPFDFPDTTFSVCAWFKTTINTGATMISEGGWVDGWSFAINTGMIQVTLKENIDGRNAYNAFSVNTYNDNKWHHVAAIITTDTVSTSGNHADIYVDGAPVSITEAKAYPYDTSNETWKIGKRTSSSLPCYFMGSLDDVRIYNNGLTQQDIAAIFPEPATFLLLGLGALMLRRNR